MNNYNEKLLEKGFEIIKEEIRNDLHWFTHTLSGKGYSDDEIKVFRRFKDNIVLLLQTSECKGLDDDKEYDIMD